MSVTRGLGVFIVAILVVLLQAHGGWGAPRPCPQFLPVAVRLDKPVPGHYNLKTLIKVKDDQENIISKQPGANDLLFPADFPRKEAASTKKIDDEPKLLLRFSELSTAPPEASQKAKSKKRRRVRPKESKRLIFDPNSSWALRTINDKPAEQVLMTDKASVARDLQDSTESALVTVHKLDEKKL